MHHGVLCIDVGQRQLHDGKQLRRRRVFLGPGFIGHNMHGADREAVVCAVRQLSIDIFLHARQGRERHLQPDDIFTRLQHIAYPVRRPGVIQNRLTFFEAGDGIGHHCRIVTLVVLDGFRQLIGIHLVINHRFTAPARVTAGEVGFAVTVGVKQLGNLRIFQLLNIGDVVLVGGFFIDQITLRRAVDQRAFTVEFLVTTGGGVHIIMQWDPVDGGEGGITRSQ